MTIAYSKLTNGAGLNVKLDGRKVGEIVPVTEGWRLLGWRYKPNGSKQAGDTFRTVEDVKRSLESSE